MSELASQSVICLIEEYCKTTRDTYFVLDNPADDSICIDPKGVDYGSAVESCYYCVRSKAKEV